MINSMPVPDLVILDLMLPEIKGPTLLTHIRSKPAWRDVKVVVVSGTEQASEVKKVIRLGVVDFIKKPFDVRRMGQDMDALFERLDHSGD